jgi:hypothetical protein
MNVFYMFHTFTVINQENYKMLNFSYLHQGPADLDQNHLQEASRLVLIYSSTDELDAFVKSDAFRLKLVTSKALFWVIGPDDIANAPLGGDLKSMDRAANNALANIHGEACTGHSFIIAFNKSEIPKASPVACYYDVVTFLDRQTSEQRCAEFTKMIDRAASLGFSGTTKNILAGAAVLLSAGSNLVTVLEKLGKF